MSEVEVLRTERLVLRHAGDGDAPFIRELVNEPAWIDFIGDRGVRSLDDARAYIARLRTMYEEHSVGLWVVVLRESGMPVGLCGLVARETLEHRDLGFALLREHWGRGYAREAAEATLAYGRETLHLPRVLAVVSPRNEASIALLGKLGFGFEKPFRFAPEGEELSLYALPAGSP